MLYDRVFIYNLKFVFLSSVLLLFTYYIGRQVSTRYLKTLNNILLIYYVLTKNNNYKNLFKYYQN